MEIAKSYGSKVEDPLSLEMNLALSLLFAANQDSNQLVVEVPVIYKEEELA